MRLFVEKLCAGTRGLPTHHHHKVFYSIYCRMFPFVMYLGCCSLSLTGYETFVTAYKFFFSVILQSATTSGWSDSSTAKILTSRVECTDVPLLLGWRSILSPPLSLPTQSSQTKQFGSPSIVVFARIGPKSPDAVFLSKMTTRCLIAILPRHDRRLC